MVTYNISISGLSSSVQLAEDDLTKVKLTSSVDKKPYVQFSFPDKDGTFENNVEFGDDVYLSINGKNVFYGYLENFTVDWRGRKLYNCVAIGRKKDLYRYFTDYGAVYSGNTNDIASSLINDYIPTSFGYTFSFQPSSSISDTGIYIDAFYPNGRTVGDCLDDLIVMDGFHWDIDNTIIKYFQPSGISKTFTYSSTSYPHPNNLGKDINNNITYVRVVGDIGYVNKHQLQSAHEYTFNGDVVGECFAVNKNYPYIDRVRLYLVGGSSSTLITVNEILKNVASSATVYNLSSWIDTQNINDEDITTYSYRTLDSIDNEAAIQLNWDETQNIRRIFWEGGIGGDNYYWKIEYWNSGSTTFSTLQSGYSINLESHLISIPIQTSSLRLTLNYLGSSTVQAKINEISAFILGFDRSHAYAIGDELASVEYTPSGTESLGWTEWIIFEEPIPVKNYDYLAMTINSKRHTHYSTYDIWAGGKITTSTAWNPPLSKDSSIYHIAYDIGFGDKIIYEASGNISRESERIPKLIVNNNIKDLNTAIAVANGILNNTSLSFSGKIIFRGDENIDLYHMISGSIEPLGIDDEFKVASYQHIIDSKNKFKTVVTVNVPEYDITSRVEKLIIQNQNATI